MKHITILAFDGCWAMSVMTVKDFFTITKLLQNHLGQSNSFDSKIFSHDGNPVNSASDTLIHVEGAITEIENTDLIIIPPIEGNKLKQETRGQQALIEWIKIQECKKIPIVALTTGAFLLAEAGLLINKLAATHWAFLKHFRKKYPDTRFITHRSYTRADNLYSTGSLTGCLDVLLHHIALEKGEHFAQLCAAHNLLTSPEQLNPVLRDKRNHEDTAIASVQDWIEENYNKTFSISELAKQFGYSERNLKRRFKLATEITPIQYLQLARLEKAKKLLIATNRSVNEISYAVGYENCSFFIRLFKKHLGVTPKQWRLL